MLLYIHIPFCDSKCYYCSFNSYTDKFELRKEYMKALYIQLENQLKDIQNIYSVFIGGGTPSTIPSSYYIKIFQLIKSKINIDKNIEITVEANPNSASLEWLTNMKNLGVNRFSFGVQSFNDKKLKYLGRSHNSSEAKKAIENAYKIGIKNISLDIIYNTQLDNNQLLNNDLDLAFNLPINHISLYSLTIEDNTVFAKNSNKTVENMKITNNLFNKIKEYGFTQYEISNFGKYQSKHNIGYWQYKDYLGIGAGAVGKIGNKRYYPDRDIKNYIKNPLLYNYENLTYQNIKDEKILLGLRSLVGIDISIFTKTEIKRVETLIKNNKIFLKNNKIFNKNFLLSDEIALFIID